MQWAREESLGWHLRPERSESVSLMQLFSRVRLFAAPWAAARHASLSITNSRSLLKLMSIESVIPSNHLILCHPLLLLPSIFPSIRVFSKKSVLHIRWPKFWSFSFSISPSNGYSGLIFFRTGWFDVLAFLRNLQSLLQHHSSKPLIIWCSAFFIVQLSHPWASLVAQLVNNPPSVWETWVRSLVRKIPWRREQSPTPVLWPGEFHGLYNP